MERSPSKSSLKISERHLTNETKRTSDIRLHTQERAIKRAIYNYTVATKFYILEQQRRQEEKLRKMIEEEEVKLLRKEMVPKAQMMPFFDKPFLPQRSSRPLTVPKEPSFCSLSSKCWSSMSCNGLYKLHNGHALKQLK